MTLPSIIAGQIQAWRSRGEIITLTQGVFDLFHMGHEYFLMHAAGLGHRLIVGVDSDEKVRARKGLGRPFDSFNTRAKALHGLGYIDLLFKKRADVNKWAYLKSIQPDYWVVTQELYDPKRFVPARAYVKQDIIVLPRYPNVSTTKLLEELRSLPAGES